MDKIQPLMRERRMSKKNNTNLTIFTELISEKINVRGHHLLQEALHITKFLKLRSYKKL